jgi:hypothetical protein
MALLSTHRRPTGPWLQKNSKVNFTARQTVKIAGDTPATGRTRRDEPAAAENVQLR